MSLWLPIGLAIVSAAVFGYICLLRLGTVYFSGKWGFTSTTARRDPPRPVSKNQLPAVIERFLIADIYDFVWISWCDDRYSGVVLSESPGSPKLFISFNCADKQQQLASFKAAMGPFDYDLDENSDGFNGGFQERFRITSLNYRLPLSVAKVIEAIDVALTNLSGSPPTDYFITASLFAHGPGGGRGIKFRPAEDPLAEVLGPR